MKKTTILFFFMFILLLSLSASAIKHRFLLIDEGKRNLLYIDETKPFKNWIVHIEYDKPRDMQLIGDNRLLIGHDRGYTEYDIKTGKALKSLALFSGVTSTRRLPNGNTIIITTFYDKASGIFMLEINPNNEVIKSVTFPKELGDFVRLARHTSNGNILMAVDNQIIETDSNGNIIQKFFIKEFEHMWKAIKIPNGNILASGGYGPFIAEITPDGKILKKIGERSKMPEEFCVRFYATFQLLPNNNIVVTNWQGHGPNNGKKGIQLFEINSNGEVVWQWSNAKIISSLQGVLILDGLDTKLLHDERNGILEQIKN